MNQVYSRHQLEAKSLQELKAIASTLQVTASDRRIKASWVDAILNAQPVEVPAPVSEIEVIGDDCVVDGVAIASIYRDENPTQPYFVLVGASEVHRANSWAKCFNYVRWHYKNGTLPQSQGAFATPQKAIADLCTKKAGLEVVEQGNGYVVKNHDNGNQYTVAKNRCSCPDHVYRNSYCKHQKAVNELLRPSLAKVIKQKLCPICLGSGALGDEEYLERCYYCDGTGKAQFAA